MKRVVLSIITVLLCVISISQVPESFNYQAIVRDGGDILPNRTVSYRFSIIKGILPGIAVYTEKHSITTNEFGLVNLFIGKGTDKTGDFTTINWGADTYSLQVEIDPSGGAAYTNMGTTQLLSVPYALHSKTVTSYSETDPEFTEWDRSTGINISNTQISNWSGATSAFLTGITSGQVTTALGFNPYNSSNPSGYTSNTGTVTSVAMSAPVGLTVAGTPVTTTGTLDLTLTSGYAIPTTDQLFPGFGSTVDKAANGNHTHDYSGVYAALVHDHSGIYEPVIAAGTTLQYWRGDKSWHTLNTDAVAEGTNLYYTDARAKAAILLTTTGNSGAATYTSGVINIPDYTLSGLGGQSALNGIGLVRMTGASVSYDNNTYLTTFTETDPNAVLLTGNQTVAGNKTFTGTTTVVTPVNANDAANKAYVDAILSLLSIKGVIVADADGNIYSTVRIGSQVWMAENLKATKFNDNTPIALVTSNSIWTTLSTPGYCWYNNDPASYKDIYGAMYNWNTMDATKNGGKNVCPTGWHIPTDAEWTTLTAYLGGDAIAGGKLKGTGTTYWNTPNTNATNETGFTALPGGQRYYGSAYGNIKNYGYWWSATEYDATGAWSRCMSYNTSDVVRVAFDKLGGFSVRCIKD